MDTADFLRRVLPDEGLYCAFTIRGKAKYNKFYGTTDALAEAVIATDAAGNSAYYAIAAFKTMESRCTDNARAIRVLAFDVDCGEGKPYPSWREGLRALGAFVAKLRLPKPLIVHSGNGLHVYWVLDRALTVPEWLPLARALKSAAATTGFDTDAGPTANAALVLRPTGTHNAKNGNTVRVLLDAAPTTAEIMANRLGTCTQAPSQRASGNLLSALAVQYNYPPADPAEVVRKCAQVRTAVEDQGDVSEPVWYALLGVAAYCEDSDATARAWSRNHPGYSATETARKLRHWQGSTTGPATCAKFKAENPKGCKGCAYAGEIGTPAQLGVQFDEVDTAADAPEAANAQVEIPRPFKRTADGIVVSLDGTDVPICGFDLYPVGYGFDDARQYETVRYMWDRPHVGWKPLMLRQALLVDGAYRDFAEAIADQGIILETRKQTEFFQVMLRSYMAELRRSQTVTNTHSNMGWKGGFTSFALGADLYRRTEGGTVEHTLLPLTSSVQRAGATMFITKGSLDTWRAGVSALAKADLLAMQYSLGTGLASVLFEFTGLKGVTISFHGPTGSGKTLAQLIQQSLWGDPEQIHFQSKFTQNVLFNRFGMHGNLPMTIDEATIMSHKDVGDYLYWVSQGRDKARLDRNIVERAPRVWALTSTLSTNTPVASKIVSSRHESDAQLARLLELRVDVPAVLAKNTEVGRKIYRLFTTNYGLAGREFVQHLLMAGEGKIRRLIERAEPAFRKRYKIKFTGNERYWEQALVLTDLALRLARDYGILDIDPAPCIQWAVAQVADMRTEVKNQTMDDFDLLAEYLNEHLSSTIRVFYIGKRAPVIDFGDLPRGSVHVRIEVRRDTADDDPHGIMYIDRTHFRRWMATNGGSYSALRKALQAARADFTPAHGKLTLGRHTPLSLPQQYVLGVGLHHPRLAGVLADVAAGRKQGDHNVVRLNTPKA